MKHRNNKHKGMRNETELIKSKAQRILTAKGNKFVWQCIKVLADVNGVSKYSTEIKEQREKLYNLLHQLILDENMTIPQIKELIKNRKDTLKLS